MFPKSKLQAKTTLQAPRATQRVPLHDQQEIKSQIEQMLQHGIIAPSVLPYASPITLVTKRDKTKRFCIDYRKLNEIIAPDVHPLPLIETILDKLSKAKYYSSVDIASAYWQVEIEPNSHNLLAFVTLDSQYEFCRLPYGFKNSPQIYHRAINQVHPDGQVHPVQYFSRALRAHERNYTVSELECLAIVESVDKFRIYLTGRLFRWILRLSTYNYEIHYLKGSQQYEEDLLLRNPFVGFVSADLIKQHQPTAFPFNIDTNGLHTITRKGVSKIIIPETLQHTLMNKVHQEYNHPGISQMTRIITTQYYWKGGGDTIAGFSKYGHSKTYLHVIVDHLTRYAWTFPSNSTCTLKYIQTLKTVLQQGLSKRLLSDRAPAFTSEKFRKFLITRGIQPLLTTSNNPQAKGLIERLNATITGKLRLAYLENPKASWTQLVKRVTQTYNNTPHSVTSFPPTHLMFNVVPPDLITHLNPYPEINIGREIARSRIQNKHKKDKETFDKQHRTPHFEVNDLVLVKNYRHPDTGCLQGGATPRPRERIVPRDREGSRVTLVSEVGFFLVEVTRRLPNVLATITQMIQGLREEKEKEKLLKEERRVLKEEEKEKRRVLKEEEKEKEELLREEEKEKEKLLREEEKEKERLLKEKRRVLKEEEKEKLLREEEKEKIRVLKEEEKEKEKLLREKEKEKERLLKEKRRVLKEEEKEKEKLLREEEKEKERLLKEKRRVLKEKEKVEERLLRQQEREEFHQKVTNMEIRLQSEIGGVQAALENNIGEVRTECKRLEIELVRMKSLEGAGFEADVKRLCHLAYPGAPIDFLDQLAAQTFIDGIRDVEAQRVLRLASFDKSREALVRALEVEAAYRVSESGHPRVRGAELIAEQSTTGGGGESDAIKEILKKLERLVEQLEETGRRSAGPCFRCGRYVHRQTARPETAGKLNSANVMGQPLAVVNPPHNVVSVREIKRESGHPRVPGAELIVEQSTTGGGGKSNAIKEILKRLERLEETGRPGRRSAGPCFRCGRHGHLKRQCTIRLPDQRQPGKLNSSNVMDRPGRKHSNADALSRGPCGDCRHCEKIDEHEVTSRRTTMVPSDDWTSESCRTIQQRDPNVGPILEWKERGNERPSWEMISDKSPELKTLWSQWDSLSIENGLLKRIWESADGKSKTMQLVVPKVQVPSVLREIHGGVSGAHFGINKMLKKVRERFYWVYYHEDVERWCKECDRCAESKGPKTRSRGVMRGLLLETHELAEALGLAKTLENATTSGFLLDNLSIMKSVLNFKTGNNLINRALLLISRFNSNDKRCTIQWIKGHSGIVGNDIADKLAKRGADSDGPSCKKLASLSFVKSAIYGRARETCENPLWPYSNESFRQKVDDPAKLQLGVTIARDADSEPVALNHNEEIPKYDGTEDPRPWIESLEEIGFLYHWADHIIVRYADMNMTGSAKTWFAEDILVLCNKVDPAMEEETKIEHVIGGLKKEYAFALYLNPLKTTDELLVVCKKIYSLENRYQECAEKSKALYNAPRSPRPLQQEQWKNAPFRRPYQNTSKPQAPAPRYYQKKPLPQSLVCKNCGRNPIVAQDKVEEEIRMDKGTEKSRPLLYADPCQVNLIEESEQKDTEEPHFQINEKLSSKEKEQLKQVLEKYADLFSSGLGISNLAKHRIDTESAKPIKHKPYRTVLESMVLPVILVKKRDGKYRFCVDNRKLNDLTVKDVYPIPGIDEVLDTLQGSKYFSEIDLKSGYWQIEVEEKDKEKTAFITAHGLYEFKVMPFGLCNAPATFERNMENMLGPLPENEWDEDYERLFLNQIIDEKDDFIEKIEKNLSGNKRSITQNFKEENGCLYKKNPNPEGREWLLVVPKKRRKDIMIEYHNYILNDHLGVARTTYRLKNKYYWPSMLKDVFEFVKTCLLCQSRKGSNQWPSELLQPILSANYPFEKNRIDFVGSLPSTKRRSKWIIVLTDYYTKYAEKKAVSEATVKEVSTFLIEHNILRHGIPRFLISDRVTRTRFTKTVNILDSEKSKTDADLGVIKDKFSKLKDIDFKLKELDQKMLDHMMVADAEEDTLNCEIEEAEHYSDTFITLKRKTPPDERRSVAKLYDKLETQLRSLESLGVDTKENTAWLFAMIESCLPEDVLVLLRPDLPCNRKEKTHVSEIVQSALANQQCTRDVTLMTLMVNIMGNNGYKRVRVLLGPCSQKSYILESTALEVKLKPVGNVNIAHSLFGGTQTETKCHKVYMVALCSNQSELDTLREFEFLGQNIICGEIPRTPNGAWLNELKGFGIWLSDLGRDSPKIELLIGSDFYGSLLSGHVRQLENGLTAIETYLGWTICGPSPKKDEQTDYSSLVVIGMHSRNMSVDDLWDLETIGIKDSMENLTKLEEDKIVHQHFLNSVHQLEDRRFCVGLPWMGNQKGIPSNCHIAKRRLFNTTRTLRVKCIFSEYDRVFQEWVTEGVIEEVSPEDLNRKCHYLHHYPVVKDNGNTIKIRPVFDASCKDKGNLSLNDCLASGPNVFEQIPAILLKFREKAIGVIAKIRKAFLQFEVKEEDRDHLRFLWWKNNHEIQVFRHKRVVFGATCSPYLLGAVILNHLKGVSSEFGALPQKLMECLYIDNCVTLVGTEAELVDLVEKSTEIFAKAKMDLRMCAYAAAAFLRCPENKGLSVQLLMAKSRLDPLKKTTIPRMELLACMLGVRLSRLYYSTFMDQDEQAVGHLCKQQSQRDMQHFRSEQIVLCTRESQRCKPSFKRVRDATAFEILGVDLAGPLYLKNKTKAWIVLFSCAVFRAIHLEFDVEATINSRPLTYIHEDFDSLIPSSPSMFLHDSKYVGVPDLDKLDSKKFQDRYLHCQRLREALRSRFRSEYLGQLVQKANERTPKLSVGDVVIVKVEDKRRLHRTMARKVELFPGIDGHSRVAKVRTKLGTLIRPVQKIYPLKFKVGIQFFDPKEILQLKKSIVRLSELDVDAWSCHHRDLIYNA
ncbi:hypothetical protein LAZ67_2005306 [Cordylochernes scorpioides]|uniref:RNA-directed DNA polymerase n=1 Tax=Cordylochernes scorpioides TaxID=51811 RepID=A0ABY6K498_9ARAC|nr:hypothetical protein LAZ67_2005306 [Cordylochernes scorpioides]